MRGRFRCKLIGTDLALVMGHDETGRPVYYRYRATTARGTQRLFSQILLPVSSGGERADLVFGMVRYGPVERWIGQGMPSGEENQLSEIVTATDDDPAVLTADSATT